jgi:hypothetical protein
MNKHIQHLVPFQLFQLGLPNRYSSYLPHHCKHDRDTYSHLIQDFINILTSFCSVLPLWYYWSLLLTVFFLEILHITHFMLKVQCVSTSGMDTASHQNSHFISVSQKNKLLLNSFLRRTGISLAPLRVILVMITMQHHCSTKFNPQQFYNHTSDKCFFYKR